jgi:hypothetical protein
MYTTSAQWYSMEAMNMSTLRSSTQLYIPPHNSYNHHISSTSSSVFEAISLVVPLLCRVSSLRTYVSNVTREGEVTRATYG